MFRLINELSGLKIALQSVRKCSSIPVMPPYNPALLPVKKCHRKPRWVPVAKSKRFRVPERHKHPEDEKKELLRLYNNYRNNVKSIRFYLIQKYSVKNQISTNPEEILRQFKEDLIRCHEINDKWNEEVRIGREKRVAEELEQALAAARKVVENRLIEKEEREQFAEEIVRQEKEASASFITPENIDSAIDKALNETVDYNFAIELTGEKIMGRERNAPKEEEMASSLKQ